MLCDVLESAVYLLRNHLEHALALQCHLRVIRGMQGEEKLTYLKTLLQTLLYLRDEKAEEIPHATSPLRV